MPHLRFSRDRRGYETTTLLHTPRKRGKGQARILYFFRTPPGVRVGRAAIDEEAIRLLEEHNPDVNFDWTRILKFPAAPEAHRQTSAPSIRHEGRARPEAMDEPHPSAAAAANPPEPLVEVAAVQPVDSPESSPNESTAILALESDDEPPAVEAPRPSVAEERLGSEGLLRLRARYAEIMARISERQLDDSAREELKALAERLNPDAWVTEEEVRAGLDSYETVLATLRPLVGGPRRRRRGHSQS